MYHILLTQAEQMCLAQQQVIQPEFKQDKNVQERKAKRKVSKKKEKKETVKMEKFKWTEEAIKNLIDMRFEKVKELKEAGKELSVTNLWLDIPLRLGYLNLTPDRACHKWNQMVKKYKDIQLKVESGTCSEEERAWPHCARMRDILEEQWTFAGPPQDSEFDLVQMAWENRSRKHAKRTRSDMWRHFVRLNSKFARCRLCERIFSYRTTVSNLKKHLLVKHIAARLPLKRKEAEVAAEDAENCDDEEGRNESEPEDTKKKRRSTIWNYFSRLDDCYAECNVCKDTFSYRSTISNLLKHRRTRHPDSKTLFTPVRRLFSRKGSKRRGLLSAVHEKKTKESSDKKQSETAFTVQFTDALQAKKGEGGSPGTKRSYLWNFFTIIDKNFAECNMCKYKLVYKSGMSNLAKHQRLKHPLMQIAKNPQTSENDPEFNEEDLSAVPEDHPTIQVTDVQSPDLEQEGEGRSRKYSYIWNFFRDLEHSRAQCNVCHKVLCYRASVFNLMKHRRLKHPNEPSYRMADREDGRKTVEDQPVHPRVKESVKKRKTSKIWQFFKYVDDVYAECRVCNKRLSHKYTSTNLLSHKNRMHPDVPFDHFPPQPQDSEDDGSRASFGDDGPGFDPPDANDSSDDNANNDDFTFNSGTNNRSGFSERPPERPKVKRKRGEKWSCVWRLFDRIDDSLAECRVCRKHFSHRSTNTNLLKHTRQKHPDVFARFNDLRRDFNDSVNELLDEIFPQSKFDPPPAVQKALPSTSSTTAARQPQQEFVIAIGKDPRSHRYNTDQPYNLPIVFIREDKSSNKTKAAPISKPTPSFVPHASSNAGYIPNNMSGEYGPEGTYDTFENNGPFPIATLGTGGDMGHVPTTATLNAFENSDCGLNAGENNGRVPPTTALGTFENADCGPAITLSTFVNSGCGLNLGERSAHVPPTANLNTFANSGCGLNMGINSGHVPTATTLNTFANSGCGLNTGKHNGRVSAVTTLNTFTNSGCGLNMGINSGHVSTTMNTFANSTCGLNTVENNDRVSAATTLSTFASGGCGPGVNSVHQVETIGSSVVPASNDHLLNVVEQSNQLLRGMQGAIQRQSEVLLRLAESIDRMKARDQEKLLTD